MLPAQASQNRLNKIESLCATHADQRYMLQADTRTADTQAQSVSVVLRRDADQSDELQAFVHGCLLLYFLQSDQVSSFMVGQAVCQACVPG